MIELHDSDHFIDVLKFASSVGAADKLADKLQYLTQYGDGKNTCHVFRDWAPYSFEFVMHHADGSRWFNGGLIYSGPGQPLDGSAPALTVGIGVDSSQHGWSIHT